MLVQLWPQEDWTPPFVLTPFVVECRAGEGFPIREIADRIAEATEDSAALAAAVPTIRDAAWAGAVKQAVARAALIGLAADRFGASRPLISLEQVRMLGRLRRSRLQTSGGGSPSWPAARPPSSHQDSLFGTPHAVHGVSSPTPSSMQPSRRGGHSCSRAHFACSKHTFGRADGAARTLEILLFAGSEVQASGFPLSAHDSVRTWT